MKTSCKRSERRFLLLAQRKMGSRVSAGGGVEDDGQSGQLKDATTDETVEVVHTLVMCNGM